MAAWSRALRAQLRCALLGVALFAAGCEQPDDVVANLSALSDGGSLAGAAAPQTDAGVPRCDTSQLYVLFSSIVRNQCRLPDSPTTIAALGAYFLQNPPMEPAETRPPSYCDLFGGRLGWAYEMTEGAGDYYLCPAHCEAASQYVAAEDQRVLACQGFSGG